MNRNHSEQLVSIIHCDQALARRLERTEGTSCAEFVEARTKAFPETQGRWTEISGTYAMFDGVDSPCTQTFGLGLFAPVTEDDLSKLEHFFQQRGSDVFHEVSPLADESLLGLLNKRGYRPCEISNVLFRQIQPGLRLSIPHDDSIKVRKIGFQEGDLWAQTYASGWADAAPGFEDLLLEMGRINFQKQDPLCFLAEKQGEPIAAAALGICEGVAHLAGASTIPKWRNQGAQLALHDYRLRFAVDKGCDIAMIVCQPGSSSQRNSERQGFRVAYTRLKWRLVFEPPNVDT